jgi:hypothetical protein
MSRQVNENDRKQVRQVSTVLAPHLIRLGRTYLACVTAPNREENSQQERQFADALGDFVIACGESRLLD